MYSTYCIPVRRFHRRSLTYGRICVHFQCTSVHWHNGIDPTDIWRQNIHLHHGPCDNPDIHRISSLLAHMDRPNYYSYLTMSSVNRNECHPLDNFDMLKLYRCKTFVKYNLNVSVFSLYTNVFHPIVFSLSFSI